MSQVRRTSVDQEVMKISANPIHFYLADEGAVLATRENGRKAADHLRALADEPGDLVLDFDGVEVASAPFLQELATSIRNVIGDAGDNGRIVLLTGMNEDLEGTLGFVLGHKKMMLALVRGDKVELLEGTPQHVETLAQAQALGSFVAPEIADKLDIQPDTATKRLTKLMAVGAVVRELDPDVRQGRRHIYRAATAELAAPPKQTQRDRGTNKLRVVPS